MYSLAEWIPVSKIVIRLLAFGMYLASSVTMKGQSGPPKISIEIDDKCLGVIRNSPDGHWVGTGFIADDPNTVITARHVAIDGTTKRKRDLTYSPPFTTDSDLMRGVLGTRKLILMRDDPATDIAVLRLDGKSPCERPFKRSSTTANKGEFVFYTGLNTARHGLMVSIAQIRNIKFENLTGYMQIEGDARPGYSGGPVLDQSGAVAGVILKGEPMPSGNWMFDAIVISSVPK